MGWRFYKRLTVVPGLRLNLSRSGVSVSIGHRGLWYTAGARGQRVTAGLPGTGIFYTESRPWQSSGSRFVSADRGRDRYPGTQDRPYRTIQRAIEGDAPRAGHRLLFLAVVWVVVVWIIRFIIGG